MKRRFPTDLANAILRFFQEYLPSQRGMSAHTIRSYRDTMVLFLRFLAQETRQRIETLKLSDFTADQIIRFLRYLEAHRHNGITTRNARLAGLHTFARFLIDAHPERMADYQRVLGIPFKRGALKTPVDYLEPGEVDTLLSNVNQTLPHGRRDYALFAIMLNTGARVQEICNLKIRDVRWDPPHQVRLVGKGNKERICPIWPRVAKLLQELAQNSDSSSANTADHYLFRNRRGEPLTRFGVRYLLRKYLPKRLAGDSPSRAKKLHPHVLRHTTAVYLLKAGVDFATISQWLGHATLNTTMRYAKADMDIKRQALAQVFPEKLAVPNNGKIRLDGSEFYRWLRRL